MCGLLTKFRGRRIRRPFYSGLCKNCLSASGQFKTKINKKHIYILVYSWGGSVQKGEHHHYPQNGYCVCMHLLVVNSLNRTYAIYNECRQQLYFLYLAYVIQILVFYSR